MEQSRFSSGGYTARLYSCGTAVVGTGAAGYNAADRLWKSGCRDVLIVTENRLAGTSRNTGSDKQTYYKLTLSGGDGDSVREMAQTLFEGQCVDGAGRVQLAKYRGGVCEYSWRGVRPIPEDDDFFENVWRSFRETGNID